MAKILELVPKDEIANTVATANDSLNGKDGYPSLVLVKKPRGLLENPARQEPAPRIIFEGADRFIIV